MFIRVSISTYDLILDILELLKDANIKEFMNGANH